MWILIDNYDSFTHMLHHYLLQLNDDVRVFRNDVITIAEIEKLNPERIIISPGPKTPGQAGITMPLITAFHDKIPILGICLGHQALAEFFGARLTKALKPVHGKTSVISHTGNALFDHIPAAFKAMRYHSLVIEDWQHTGLLPLAFTVSGELMAFRHEALPLTGIQFHPESVLTEYGLQILINWDNICNENL